MGKSLKTQAKEILKEAERTGLKSNYFFATTFERYQQQLRMLDELKAAIDDIGMTVTKEYVKGRQNIVINPAIGEYNKTSTAANSTVAALINILKTLSEEAGGGNGLRDLIASLNDDG